jgi:hypothetical protein
MEATRLERVADESVAAAADDLTSPYEASQSEGVPSSTIHKWAAHERIDSYPAPPETRLRYPNAILVSRRQVREERDYRAARVSARRAGEILGVAETTTVYYVENGHLPGEQRGRLWEIPLAAIHEAMESGRLPLGPRRVHPVPEKRECEREGCDARFTPGGAQAANGQGRYCSSQCYGDSIRKYGVPEERVCKREGCNVRFTPEAWIVAYGFGEYCSRKCVAGALWDDPEIRARIVAALRKRMKREWDDGGYTVRQLVAKCFKGSRTLSWTIRWSKRAGPPRGYTDADVKGVWALKQSTGWGRPRLLKFIKNDARWRGTCLSDKQLRAILAAGPLQ